MTESFTLSSEPTPAKRQRLIPEPVELLTEHPFADRKWMLVLSLEPRWFPAVHDRRPNAGAAREPVPNCAVLAVSC